MKRWGFLVAAVVFMSEATASADDASCIAAARTGQRLRAHAQLVAAREQFLACAMASCPRVVRSDCDRWFAEVETVMPTIVVVASEHAQDVTDVAIAIGGRTVAESLDGKAFPIDPGPHVIRATRGGRSMEQRVVIAEGEKTRKIAFVLDSAAPLTPSPPEPAARTASPRPVRRTGTSPSRRSSGRCPGPRRRSAPTRPPGRRP